MAKAKVLYIHMTGVSSEILKNLVLAGIRAAICDSRPYPEAVQDTPSLFLTGKQRSQQQQQQEEEPPSKKPKTDNNATTTTTTSTVAQAMKPLVEELNPLLGECQIVTPDKLQSYDFLTQFSIIVASRTDMAEAMRLSHASPKFFLVDTFGWTGACVLDLGPEHTYRTEVMGQKKKKKQLLTVLDPSISLDELWMVPLSHAVNRFHKTAPPLEWIQYRCLMEYATLRDQWPTSETADDFVQLVQEENQSSEILSLSDRHHELLLNDPTALRQLATVATREIAPVCAVMGGVVGNEVIKAISGKGEPANNTILLDGRSGKVKTFLVQLKRNKTRPLS